MSAEKLIHEPKSEEFLMGNEAIARGAIEAGVKVVTAYPGTPSTEIVGTLAKVGLKLGIHVEWSVNEHVALEVASGAAQCNVRSLCAMKHNGLSVACDMLTHISIRDITGGMVIVSADDPGLHSSQTEHDTRWMARCACIPIIEPSSPQEAKDFTKYAFEISEEIGIPILIRTVTNLSHMWGKVTYDKINKEERKASFDFEKLSLSEHMKKGDLPIPFWHPGLHRKLHEKEEKIKEKFENFSGNRIESNGTEKFGVIASGISYNYVVEALQKLNLDKVALLKLATPYPLPENMISRFLTSLNEVLILEELEPFVEMQIKGIAKDVNPDLKIYGKNSGHIPREGELSGEKVANVLAQIFNMEKPYRTEPKTDLFPRMLTMCAGCPHRSVGYALKKAIRKVTGSNKGAIVDNDIGCYILLMVPPYSLNDMSFCMGAGLSVAQGRYHAGVEQIPVALIGDSTFIHGGIPGLINAVYNKAKIKLVIMDNNATAMTGFQPHPGTGNTATGEKTKAIKIEDIVKACGVDFVKIVDPYNYEETYNGIVEMLEFDGPAVVISRRLCATEALRRMRRKGEKIQPYYIDPQICIKCGICSTQFACPAISWDAEKRIAKIVPDICTGCGVCAQICPSGAILRGEENE
ncbi:indolepyruvate ferredoxin oxidoreductase subunit alpha [Thermococci archaeon]|nr:MAG: indolepyruvate ferredoxin oxidoreductase subunit alpha [Thermococci archaeon]